MYFFERESESEHAHMWAEEGPRARGSEDPKNHAWSVQSLMQGSDSQTVRS